MIKVNVATLKAELSKYLDMAQHGQAFIVTSHGEEIAKIGPAQTVTSSAVDWKKFFSRHSPIKSKRNKPTGSEIIHSLRDED